MTHRTMEWILIQVGASRLLTRANRKAGDLAVFDNLLFGDSVHQFDTSRGIDPTTHRTMERTLIQAGASRLLTRANRKAGDLAVFDNLLFGDGVHHFDTS